jgi:hypothetical protein
MDADLLSILRRRPQPTPTCEPARQSPSALQEWARDGDLCAPCLLRCLVDPIPMSRTRIETKVHPISSDLVFHRRLTLCRPSGSPPRPCSGSDTQVVELGPELSASFTDAVHILPLHAPPFAVDLSISASGGDGRSCSPPSAVLSLSRPRSRWQRWRQ